MTDILIIFSAEYLVWVIATVALLFVVYSKAYKRRELYILSGLISVTALVLDKTLNAVIFSPRPFVVEKTAPLVSHLANNGFPSEHTLFAFVLSGIIFLYNKKIGIILAVLSVLVGIGRVLAKVHNPIDIIGSFAIAIVSVYTGYLLCRKIYKFYKLT